MGAHGRHSDIPGHLMMCFISWGSLVRILVLHGYVDGNGYVGYSLMEKIAIDNLT